MITEEALFNKDLSDDRFDKILEYLYWKAREESSNLEKDRQLELRKIELTLSKGSKTIKPVAAATAAAAYSSDYTTEDIDFNHQTGFGYLPESQLGKLSKTKLWDASKITAQRLYEQYEPEIKQVFKPSPKYARTKTLLQYILWGSSLANRADRWTHAKDMDFLLVGRDEINLKLGNYQDNELVAGAEFLKKHWGAICSNEKIHLNTTLIAHRLDSAYELHLREEEHLETYNVLNSPFVSKLLEKYDYVDKDAIKARIEANKFDYRAATSFEILQQFRSVRPSNIEDSDDPWKMRYLSYIDDYQKELQEDIRIIWNNLKDEQDAWDKQRKKYC
jgi:hypothetical protein